MRLLREELSDETEAVSDEELRGLVVSGVERAQGYGIVHEDDVQIFIALLLVHGADFGADPESWAGRILTDGSLTGARKVTALVAEHQLREEQADEL